MKNSALSLYQSWLSQPTEDKILENDLHKLKKEKDIIERFSNRMSFGTAGIRGILGAGTNKINIYTIAAAAEAYAQYLIKCVPNAKKQGVVIGHDNRHNWEIFSQKVVKVLNYYGIKAYLFEKNDLQPTPLISYAIRTLKAAGGVILTASHNPANYNGFKVYNELGAQLTTKYTKIISKNMDKINFLKVHEREFKPYYINKKLIDSYVAELLKLQVRLKDDKQLRVVYSPLHGTGHELGPKLLRRMGYSCFTVNSQMKNDPNFSKTKSPNPEDDVAYNKAISLARKTKSDLVLLTDPDADRLGVVTKYKRRFKYLNGNQVAALYLNFLLTNLKINNKIPKNGYIVKSNVSSDLATSIARKFGVKVYEVHVGFKNIAELIESKKGEHFLFGFEESFGFLINPSISRDKDAIQGVVSVAEMANYYKTQKSDLYSELLKLFDAHDFHRSITIGKKMEQDTTNRFFTRLLTRKKLGNKRIVKIEDYRKGLHGLEKTNLIKVYLENSGWFAVRPSGTEPKIKFYFDLKGNTIKDVVILEQEINDDIISLTEEDLKVSISKKTIWKFTFFIAILIIIMIILLYTVYNLKSGHQGILSIFVHIWNDMTSISRTRRIWILLVIATPFIQLIPSALFIRRAMKSLGAKISLWHSFLAQLLAISISAVTPFATGGALAAYWYLRKKGYSRKILLSAFLMESLVYQFTLVLRTLVFIPLGFWIFNNIYFGSGPTSRMILILTMIGLIFDIFSTVMIGLLTMHRGIQESILQNSIALLEWLPFIRLSDPLTKMSKYEHEFFLLRQGMNQIFSQKTLMLELIFYESINIFYSGYLFGAFALSPQAAHFHGNLYIQFLTGTNLLRSANNMIPTPGGSGTTEWMSKEIFKKLFAGGDSSATFTGMIRIATYIFPIAVSSFALTMIYINESLNHKVNIINKNNKLNKIRAIKVKNHFNKYVLGLTGVVAIILFIVFVTLLFKS